METLHEFMLVTKGREYLIAIGFLIVFIVFWKFLFGAPTAPATAKVFDLLGFRIPRGMFFHPGHAWALPQPGGTIRVGIDDFLHRLTGPLDTILISEKGTRVTQGESLFHLKVGSRMLRIPAPVSGEVAVVRAKGFGDISNTARRSVKREWLVAMKPSSCEEELGQLTMAEQAAEWLKGEMERFREFLSAQSVRSAMAHATLADGGEPVIGVLGLLDDKGWEDFQKEFMATGREQKGAA